MKPFYLRLILACISLSSASIATAQTVPTPDEFTKREVGERRQVMRGASVLTQQRGTDVAVVELIAAGLRDPDDDVKALSLAPLSTLLQRDASGKLPAVLLDSTVVLVLRDVLLERLEDSDVFVRKACMAALLSITDIVERDAVARAVVRMYDEERDDGTRVEILRRATKAYPTDQQVRRVVLSALRDSSSRVRIAAATASADARVVQAVPLIAEEIQKGDLETRQAFVRALARFGADARPYLNVLNALIGAETRENVQDDIRRAIDMISRTR